MPETPSAAPSSPRRAPLTVVEVHRLDDERARAVEALARDATEHDGIPPLSEAFQLAIRGDSARHLLAYAGSTLVGYAQQTSPGEVDSAAELVVAPEARRRGVGTALLLRLPRQVRIWIHGSTAGGPEFAAARGLRTVRRLFILGRAMTEGGAALPPVALPAGLRARAFEPGVDDEALVAVNAAAFADHPEQGAMGLDGLRARMSQPWFDPQGLIVVSDTGAAAGAGGGRDMAAFHWTKIEARDDGGPTVGEVYVVGVHPAYQGRGLGREVTLLGMHHLASRGVDRAILYVDGDNEPAVRTYRKLGFDIARVETMVTPTGTVQSGTIGAMTTADVQLETALPENVHTPPPSDPHVAISAGIERRTPTRGAGGRFVKSTTQAAVESMPSDRYLEREISWLQFNERVLQMAMDERIPLLERAKFLAIFTNNLDEFFMVRVAGLKRRIATGLAVRSAAGLEPRELLDRISTTAQDLMRLHSWVFWDQVRPALHEELSLIHI